MTEELKELGLNVGHRRVGRLMRENGKRALGAALKRNRSKIEGGFIGRILLKQLACA